MQGSVVHTCRWATALWVSMDAQRMRGKDEQGLLCECTRSTYREGRDHTLLLTLPPVALHPAPARLTEAVAAILQSICQGSLLSSCSVGIAQLCLQPAMQA